MVAKLINKLDKKYAFGLVTGLIFGLLSVYTDFFRNTSPHIQFDILSNTTVVDLKENIGKIDILYDSTSILLKKQTLSLITLKIANTGNSDVLKNFYDNHFPLGFKIDDGIILENPTLIQSSNNYIGKSIGLTLKNQNEINFTDFIFEKDEFFILKILVLHSVNKQPEIIPEGKVAGVKQISVVKSYLSKGTKTFWERVVDGSLIVHVTRFITYSICMILFALGIIIPISLIGQSISTRRRKKKLKLFKIHLMRDFSDPEIFISDIFINNGLDALKLFKEISSNYPIYCKIFESEHLEQGLNEMMINNEHQREIQTLDLIKQLKAKKYATVEDGKLIFKDCLDEFIYQLIGFIENNK